MSTGRTATERNTERTRADLLAAAVALIERGEEPTMRAVANDAGVGERTIYRYFESRESLLDAVANALRPLIGAPLCDSIDGLHDYIDTLFANFETNHALTVATVASPWVQPYLATSRSANLRALTAILHDAFPRVDPDDLGAAAASLRTVLSGAGWVYQRESCELPAAAVRAHAHWLADTLLVRLTELDQA